MYFNRLRDPDRPLISGDSRNRSFSFDRRMVSGFIDQTSTAESRASYLSTRCGELLISINYRPQGSFSTGIKLSQTSQNYLLSFRDIDTWDDYRTLYSEIFGKQPTA